MMRPEQRVAGLLLAVLCAVARPAGGAPLRATVQGLEVAVTTAASNVFAVTIRPVSASDSTPAAADGACLAAGTVEARWRDGSLEVRRRGAAPDAPPAWCGRVAVMDAYGRTAVPGTRLEWDAQPGEAIYGLGQRFNGLNQAGRIVEMWIRDVPGQGEQGGASYFCTPVLFSSAGYALFAADNPEGQFFLNALGQGSHRYVRAGQAWTFYLAFAPTLKELVLQRARIQGPFRGVPDWAWGPWISRNSYPDQAAAEKVIREMARRGLPVAAIVQEAWKGPYETGEFNRFSPHGWPDPDRYFRLCRGHGIRTVLWQVPAMPPSHPGLADLAAAGYFVRAPDGAVSWRREWLAGFANVDFTRPGAVAWWQDQMRDAIRRGAGGIKADDGEDIKADDVFADGRRGWEMHNEYAVRYAEALYGLLDREATGGLLWCRSASLGSERTPALWAGDQHATWAQYRSLPGAGLSAGLSGAPFWGHDIGGYAGDPSPELYIRWLQFGAFSPMMQYHGISAREPWSFGRDAEAAYRLLAHLRMNLKPTLIELGREAAATGLPVMRPMVMEFPGDPQWAAEDSQYMLGAELLVAPLFVEGSNRRNVRFPPGRWRHLLSPAVFEGPAEHEITCGLVDAPVYVREGARLKVQLAPGAALGTWSPDAPIRILQFGRPR